MDPAIWLTALGIVGLVVLHRHRRVGSGPTHERGDLADLMSGLFVGGRGPTWPRGVQEEDTIRPWTGTGSVASDADPVAILEDSADPIPVAPVRPAA